MYILERKVKDHHEKISIQYVAIYIYASEARTSNIELQIHSQKKIAKIIKRT